LNIFGINPGVKKSRTAEIANLPEKSETREKALAAVEALWSERARAMPSIPRVEITSFEDLFNQYIITNQPVIITNFQDSWAPASSFSTTNLNKTFGNNLVRVSISETGRFDGPDKGSNWGLPHHIDVLVRPPTQSMVMTDFLQLLRRKTDEVFYLEYSSLSQYLGQVIINHH